MRIISTSVVVPLALIGVLISGQVIRAANASPQSSKDQTSKDTVELYLKNCSVCHGEKGDAQTRTRSGLSPAPRDFTTAEAAMELTRERMIKAVTNGVPGTAMVAHKDRLSESQIAALVDYVRAKFMRVPVAEQTGLPESVSLGEKIYTKNCAVCHGDKGNTAYWAKNGLNPPPKDFTSPLAQSQLTRDRMIHSVTHGRPGTGMMPFSKRLSGDEIKAVVRFIRFKFMGVDPDKDTGAAPLAQLGEHARPVDTAMVDTLQTDSPSAGIPGVDMPLSAARPGTANPHQMAEPPQFSGASSSMGMPGAMTGGHEIKVDMDAPIPHKLKADVNWGRQFFMKNCFTCHGVKGDGKGPRAYFNRPPPRNFTSSASRQILNRTRIFDGITNGRVGSVMPAWGKVLSEQEIANLTEFVFQAFILGKGAEGKGASTKESDANVKTGKVDTGEIIAGKKKAS